MAVVVVLIAVLSESRNLGMLVARISSSLEGIQHSMRGI